jgi:uncharacterized membrane protein
MWSSSLNSKHFWIFRNKHLYQIFCSYAFIYEFQYRILFVHMLITKFCTHETRTQTTLLELWCSIYGTYYVCNIVAIVYILHSISFLFLFFFSFLLGKAANAMCKKARATRAMSMTTLSMAEHRQFSIFSHIYIIVCDVYNVIQEYARKWATSFFVQEKI